MRAAACPALMAGLGQLLPSATADGAAGPSAPDIAVRAHAATGGDIPDATFVLGN